MIQHIRYTALVTLVFLFSCSAEPEDILPYAPSPSEIYDTDTLLQSFKSKRALIVTAHDDDMCAMSGTISLLNKQGWEIQVLSFHQNEERDNAQRTACKNILDTVCFFDLDYAQWRKDLKETKEEELYLPIPQGRFSITFNTEVVQAELLRRVNRFNPSVIFTLDNEIGGYGHPEHVFISQLVVDLAQSKQIDIQYIYQSVYTPHMTTRIMARHAKRMVEWGYPGNRWELAKAIYKVNGMPLPTTQIFIKTEANAKMAYLKSYNEREQKTIDFFIPAFRDYSAEDYFSIFDREFYRIIRIN